MNKFRLRKGVLFLEKKVTYTFEQFWSDYPKKTGKKDCERRFSKLTAIERKRIEDTLSERVKTDENWSAGKFVPNPATYLNQGRWDDQYTKKPGVSVREVQNKIVQTICPSCQSHVASQRHQNICKMNDKYYDLEVNSKRYVLNRNGSGVSEA